MAFKVSARMILELGAELISSDAVALYELIKNGVDAGSPAVEVHIQVVLRRSLFLEALEALDDDGGLDDVRDAVLSNVESGAPSASRHAFRQALLAAGGSATRFRNALLSAYHEHNWILVRDTGHGMTRQELNDVFLTIGTRSRRSLKVAADGSYTAPTQTVLGDKGVGRLSAMRLGDHMVVTTSRGGEVDENVLDIDWTRFSHESADLMSQVKLNAVPGERKRSARSHGTSILIRNLRGDWDAGTFRRMVDEQFARIVDPFPSARGKRGWRNPDELFDLRFNDQSYDLPTIPEWLLDTAHAVVKARYRILPDGSPVLSGDIQYQLRNRETQFEVGEAELISLTDPIADRMIRTGPQTLRDLGPFDVEFYWYNRRILKELPDIGKKRGDVVGEVNDWAGGLMVFRDFFRINPYGGLEDDWLELDKKALGARGYKVNRSQLIGKVSLTSRNFRLVEQTNREGLAENEYKQILVGMLRHIIITEFRTFIERVDRDRKVSDESTADDLEQRIEQASSRVEEKLLQLRRDVPEQRETLNELSRLTANLIRVVEQAKAMAQEYEDDRSKFVHLAGIGLMVEFLLHEIGRATHRALQVMDDIDTTRLDRSGSASLRTLQDQLVTLGKRVDTLDPLSASRRQTRESFDVIELVRQVVDGRADQLRRHKIRVVIDAPARPFKIKAVKGMILQILENLFENSVYWLKVEQRRGRPFHAQINISVDPRAREIVFTDNGPGVARARSEEIFEPFVTSKPPGQGRGLGLYISREMARYHDWELSMSADDIDDEGRQHTFVLEMGET